MRRMREWDCRVLSYINDFLVTASSRRAAGAEDSENLSDEVERLMEMLGLGRYRKRGIFGRGSTMVEHLGFRWESVAMEFTVTDAKQENVRAHATSLLNEMA